MVSLEIERLSKVIITLKPHARTAQAVENALNAWLWSVSSHLICSITFDCGKEFSNWREISNNHDLSIYFADPGTPSQCALNEGDQMGYYEKMAYRKKWILIMPANRLFIPLRQSETIFRENR